MHWFRCIQSIDGAMRNQSIEAHHPAYRSLHGERTDRFLLSISTYFLQYLKYSRMHARLMALKQLSAPDYGNILWVFLFLLILLFFLQLLMLLMYSFCTWMFSIKIHCRYWSVGRTSVGGGYQRENGTDFPRAKFWICRVFYIPLRSLASRTRTHRFEGERALWDLCNDTIDLVIVVFNFSTCMMWQGTCFELFLRDFSWILKINSGKYFLLKMQKSMEVAQQEPDVVLVW